MKNILVTIILLFTPAALFAQVSRSSQLYKTLKTADSLLFNIGYNTCDIQQFEDLLSDNFEFYHDEAGIMNSKPAFIASVRDGLCKLPYKAERRLVDGSLVVYPLERKGVIYGAIQSGEHQFYAVEKDKPTRMTSTAKFTNLWLLESGNWKLSRSLSYDHKKPVGK